MEPTACKFHPGFNCDETCSAECRVWLTMAPSVEWAGPEGGPLLMPYQQAWLDGKTPVFGRRNPFRHPRTADGD